MAQPARELEATSVPRTGEKEMILSESEAGRSLDSPPTDDSMDPAAREEHPTFVSIDARESNSSASVKAQSAKNRAFSTWASKISLIRYYMDHNGGHSQPDESTISDDRPLNTWITTFIRFGPLSGILTMFLAAGAIVASLGILVGSDCKPVQDWTVTPSTYIAAFTAIANLSVRYAAVQGVVIAW